MLSEAIDLLDLSHAPENKECPQRICAVQDLTNCYGVQDGPGFFEERVSVARETLATINGSWPCYVCIGSELVEAYIDIGDYEAGLTEIKHLKSEVEKSSGAKENEFPLIEGRLLLLMGQLQDAQSLLSDAVGAAGGTTFLRKKQQLLTLIYIQQGEWDKAESSCLSFDEAMCASSYFDDWIEAQCQLIAAGRMQIAEALLFQIQHMASILVNKGAIRVAVSSYRRLVDLAFQIDAHFIARAALQLWQDLLPQLQQDLGASETFEKMLARVPVQDENLLSDTDDVECLFARDFDCVDKQFQTYEQALKRWPDNVTLLVRMSEVYQQVFQLEKARELLEQAVKRYPENAWLEYQRGEFLLKHDGIAVLARLFSLGEPSLPDDKRWFRLWLHLESVGGADPAKALEYARALVAIDPEHEKALYKAAQLSMAQDEYQESLGYWRRLVQVNSENTDYQWDLMMCASLAEDWGAVSATAARLELDFDEQKPINQQEFGYIRVQLTDDNGATQNFVAQRVGPVMARIEGVATIDSEQYYNHVVVFDPQALNLLDCKDEDGNPCDSEGSYTRLFPVYKTVSAPQYQVFDLDGVHPGDEALADLQVELQGIQVILKVRSNHEYELEWSQDSSDQCALGLYAYLLAPEGTDCQAVHAILQAFSCAQSHRLVWTRLVEQLLGDEPGLEAVLESQWETFGKYGL